jgi:hypothetical protein
MKSTVYGKHIVPSSPPPGLISEADLGPAAANFSCFLLETCFFFVVQPLSNISGSNGGGYEGPFSACFFSAPRSPGL